jgi:hypothetical protein
MKIQYVKGPKNFREIESSIWKINSWCLNLYKKKMKRFIVVLLAGLFVSSLLISCKAMNTLKKGEDAEITTPPNVGSNKLSKKRQ